MPGTTCGEIISKTSAASFPATLILSISFLDFTDIFIFFHLHLDISQLNL